MLDEIREIIARENITSAAIIDDVYDEVPTSSDIDDTSWGFFRDDVSEEELGIIREGYDVSDPESRWDELRKDDNFIKFLWERRGDSSVFHTLFNPYVDHQEAGKALLEPLNNMLFKELGLQGGTFDSHRREGAADAQLLFMDLFLGSRQDESARDKALERVKEIVAPRRESPPMIVLMSSSTRLQEFREDFRDDAGLLGCQFRTIQKAVLTEEAELHELLYRLTNTYQDSLKLSGLLEYWHKAIDEAKSRFLKTVRRLDLRDYADLQSLILEAEGEMIGAYLLEVFGRYFQFELEEDERLSAAALKLNEVTWEQYPAPHFLPAEVSANLTDGMLFRSPKIHAKTEPLQFGDVLLSTRVDALGEREAPVANFANGERIALVVLTAACDIQHNNATRYLFMAGVAKPSRLLFHRKPKPLITPMLIHEGTHYVVEWDTGTPVAWTPRETHKQIESGKFVKARRFRSLFSLQLQQLFASSLSRVGTPVMPPMQQLAGASIFYKDQTGFLHSLISVTPEERQAVLLVGRDEKDHLDRLILSPELVKDLKVSMQKVDSSSLPERDREAWATAVRNRQLFTTMERGIPYTRDQLKRSFSNTSYDIVTVIGPYVSQDRPPVQDGRLQGSHGPLVIQITMPEVSTEHEAEKPAAQ